MSAARRKELEPAFLLHHRPWSETSLILDLLTRRHGRITLFARGARRPGSRLRPVLRPFVALLVSWSGRGDGGTLTGAERGADAAPLPAARVLSAWYLNELLIRLLPREDRHEALYDAYAAALQALAAGAEQPALRAFERALLDELGYGVDLAHEAAGGGQVEADRYYHFQAGRGLLEVRDGDPGALRGADLLAVSRGELGERRALRAARAVYGAAIAHCLEGRGLASRDVMLALRKKENKG